MDPRHSQRLQPKSHSGPEKRNPHGPDNEVRSFSEEHFGDFRSIRLDSIRTAAQLREAVFRDAANVELEGEYLENPGPQKVFPFSRHLLATLDESEPVLETRYDANSNLYTAGLQGILGSPDLVSGYLLVDVIDPSGINRRPPALSRGPEDRLCFSSRFFKSAQEWRGNRTGTNPDVVALPDSLVHDPEVRERALKCGVIITPVAQLERKELGKLLQAKAEIEYNLLALHRQIKERSRVEWASRSLNELLHILLEDLVDNFQKHPFLVRSIMFRLDHVVLPLMRTCGHPLAFIYKSSDELIVSPLLYYHRDEQALLSRARNLSLSPLASLMAFAADALHMRYFSNYDAEDILKIPYLLDTILPEVEGMIAEIERLSGTPLSARRSIRREERIQNNLYMYVRGLLNGLVMMTDLGAFADSVPSLEKYVLNRHKYLTASKWPDYAMKLEDFFYEIRERGTRFFKLMKRAYRICPEEFGSNIRPYFEYFHGYYGSDEERSVQRFNLRHSPEREITLLQVLTGSPSRQVQVYFYEHRGLKPRGQSIQTRSQFSREARRHVLQGRQVWRIFNAAVMGERPRLQNLTAMNPRADLADAVKAFKRAGTQSREGNDSNSRFYLATCEYLTRLAPPLDNLDDLERYRDEGTYLYHELERITEQAELRYLNPAMRAMKSHLARINRLLE